MEIFAATTKKPRSASITVNRGSSSSQLLTKESSVKSIEQRGLHEHI